MDYEKVCFYDVCNDDVVQAASACRSIAAYVARCLQHSFNQNQIEEITGWKRNSRFSGECGEDCNALLRNRFVVVVVQLAVNASCRCSLPAG